MMLARMVKTEKDYREMLRRIEALMDSEAGTPEGDELELLAMLVENYEREKFPIGLPDPVEAIKFRMEQQGLKPHDLTPYIGSRSKVSEVLNRQRPLSLKMMRNLHSGLGIPAEVLLQEPGSKMPDEIADLARYPVKEMIKRKWIQFEGTLADAEERAEELVRSFFQTLGLAKTGCPVMLRQCVRNDSSSDQYALSAWLARIQILAQKQAVASYAFGSITPDFMRRLVSLSYLDEGPRLAVEFLAKSGIHLIVEKYLRRTQLDGAVLIDASGNPVVGLTLFHNRLDNFWFTLCHELAHIKLHLETRKQVCFVDDLDKKGDNCEDQANEFAAEALIPSRQWKEASVRELRTPSAVVEFANRLRIHPAIVAGRIRKEQNNYCLLSSLVGQGVPSRLFFSE